MSKHRSHVLVELPDGPKDPSIALVTIRCAECGEHIVRIPVAHVGSVGRALTDTIKASGFSGETKAVVPGFVENTASNKRKMLDYLDSHFPTWRGDA